MEIEQKFKLGQEVEVVRSGQGARIGERVTINRIDSEEPMYRVLGNEAFNVWLNTGDLAEVPERTLKYEVGQTVYAVDDSVIAAGTQGQIVTVDADDYMLSYRVHFEDRYFPRWVTEGQITDEAPDTPLKYRVGQRVYVTPEFRAIGVNGLPDGTPGTVVEVDHPKSIWPYRVAFDGHGEMWLTAESITDEAPEPEYLPVGTEVIVRGVINYVDNDDDELTYRVEFTNGQYEWLHAENVQPVDDDEHLNIGADAGFHPVGQYGYGVADEDEQEYQDGDSVVVVNKSLGVEAGTVGTFIEYDEDGDCVIEASDGLYFIKNRDLAYAYPVTESTPNESSIIATEDVRIPGTSRVIKKGTTGEMAGYGLADRFPVRWDTQSTYFYMEYQDSYVVYE